MRGEMGRMCSYGQLDFPVMFRSHGGRARAIDEGSLEIDVAFIAAPSCDRFGNLSGAYGPSACGGLGYATPDAAHARCVVAVTDNLVDEPLADFSIPGSRVDFIAQVDSIGDPTRISAGATRLTRNPIDLVVAEKAAQVIRSSSLYKPGFSIQFGAGGASLAIVKFLTDYMREDDVKSSFILGGMTSQCVEWLENGLTSSLFDMQCFDLAAVKSQARNARHTEIGTSQYASPAVPGALVNYLDLVILAAMEVDLDFNVNVLTGSDGVVRGAPGGHPDSSQGAKLSMIVAPATRARLPLVLDEVGTVVTPGKDIACVVTDLGVAWNPIHADLAPKNVPGLEIMDIKELKKRIERLTGVPKPVKPSGKVVAVVESRDGTIMDVLRAVE
jgi:citrate lyase subunit alpha/citrate CoA-transferase